MEDLSERRRYFSERQGRGPKAEPMSFERLRRLAINVLDGFRERGYLQQAFGYQCVDAGRVNGTLGADPGAYFLRTIMREGIWPYWEPDAQNDQPFFSNYEPEPLWEAWDADTLFDVIEVMHDLVSRPTDGRMHEFGNCGMHYTRFDRAAGGADFRREMNELLRYGDPPYEIDEHGHIVESGPEEFDRLLSAPVPPGTDQDIITSRIVAATTRFRARGASIEDRQHAVRDLADVLEPLRKDIRETMLTADEKAIFHLANGFAIRHNNREQKRDYDRVTWLRWAFYVYLATIHAVLRVRRSQQDG